MRQIFGRKEATFNIHQQILHLQQLQYSFKSSFSWNSLSTITLQVTPGNAAEADMQKQLLFFLLVHADQSTQYQTQTCFFTPNNTDMKALNTIMAYYPRTSEFISVCQHLAGDIPHATSWMPEPHHSVQ